MTQLLAYRGRRSPRRLAGRAWLRQRGGDVGRVKLQFAGTFEQLIALRDAGDEGVPVAVDIPMGLCDTVTLGHKNSIVTHAVYVHEIKPAERATRQRARLEERYGGILGRLA